MAGGNYGGASIPTLPVPGNTLWAGKDTTYKDYKCTAYVGNADNLTFNYDGGTIISTTSYIQTIINPSSIESNPTAAITFFCYSCSCSALQMTGGTDAGVYDIYGKGILSGVTHMFRPTIIGGGGLNS